MQVNHVQDHITHAVIGGQKSMDFGISDSAEFFNILSSTLYSDQKLAVVRETLCNGWDAHIEAGCTDVALEVTINSKELVIQDFGKGIPKEMIGPVYGVYGGSTKKANGAVTGGFGLGCKAPFAYTDHFEVTSCADGMKTIYNMSKSSAELGGKPSITPIVSVPTTEHGITVRMLLTNQNDRNKFEELVRRIAKNGDMRVNVNGSLTETLPFSEMKHNFFFTKDKLVETDHKILLRYGNVIYPVEENAAYLPHMHRVLEIVKLLPGGNYWNHSGWRVVFQAQPDTISVTPSRESLSMQEHTIKNITKILEDFQVISEESLKIECFKILEQSLKTVGLNNKPVDLLYNFNSVPNLHKQVLEQNYIMDFPEFATHYAAKSYPEYSDFRAKDYLGRIDTLIKTRFGNQKLLKSFRTELSKRIELRNGRLMLKRNIGAWFARYVKWPLIKGLNADPDMSLDKMFVYKPVETYGKRNALTKLSEYKNSNFTAYAPFLRNVVILAHNRADVEDRAHHFPIFKHWLGNPRESLVYTVPRSTNKIEAARAFFEKRGYTLVDLTIVQKWETPTVLVPVARLEPVKPRKKGVPVLKGILKEDKINIDTSFVRNDEAERIEDPEFVILIADRNGKDEIGDLGKEASRYILEFWGDVGGVVVNTNQQAKFTSSGVLTFNKFVLGKLLTEFENNKNIREYLPFDFKRDTSNFSYYADSKKNLFEAIYADTDLREYFGFIDNRNDRERKLYTIWLAMEAHARIYSLEETAKIKQIFKDNPISPLIGETLRSYETSKLKYVANPEYIKDLMLNKNPDYAKAKQVARDFLLEVIEG